MTKTSLHQTATAIRYGALVLLLGYVGMLPDPTDAGMFTGSPVADFTYGFTAKLTRLAVTLAVVGLVWGSQVAARKMAARVEGWLA